MSSAPAALPGVSPQTPCTAQQAAGGTPLSMMTRARSGSVGLVVVIGDWNREAGAWYSRTVWQQTRVYHGQASLASSGGWPLGQDR